MNVMTSCHRPITRSIALVLFAWVLLYSANSFANSADWGLVQRFKGQLQKAQEGNVSAMYNVGRLFERGRGTNRNYQSAIEWYQKASDAGNSSARARLGKMYLEGKGVNKDAGKAYQLILAAARDNIPAAQYQMGIMYEIGIGTEADDDKALFWYKKAAALGHYQAERKLAKFSSAPAPTPAPAPAQQTTRVAAPAATGQTSNWLIEAIARGNWKQGSRDPGYLPSAISNCKKITNNKLLCISTEQERNTGSETITFNMEANIQSIAGNRFTIEYVNNVLDIELQENETVSGVETDDEAANSVARQSSIKKGKQEKVHHLDCTYKNKTAISCLKDKIRTLNFTR